MDSFRPLNFLLCETQVGTGPSAAGDRHDPTESRTNSVGVRDRQIISSMESATPERWRNTLLRVSTFAIQPDSGCDQQLAMP